MAFQDLHAALADINTTHPDLNSVFQISTPRLQISISFSSFEYGLSRSRPAVSRFQRRVPVSNAAFQDLNVAFTDLQRELEDSVPLQSFPFSARLDLSRRIRAATARLK